MGDRLFVHHVAGLRPRRLDDRHVGGNAHHFLSGADGEPHVDGRYRANAQCDIGTLGDLKSLLLNRQRIGSDGKPDQTVKSGVIADRRACKSGAWIDSGHSRSSDCGAAGIGDGSVECSASDFGLRIKTGGGRKKAQQ